MQTSSTLGIQIGPTCAIKYLITQTLSQSNKNLAL